MSFNRGYKKYATVESKRQKAEKSIEKLKKKDPEIQPVIITGRKIATTWWGKSWNDNLERYSDYENRIGRGRSYVKNGAVLDLKITQGNVEALVQGSRAKPYKVSIIIEPLKKDIWERVVNDCGGKIESLQELIEGKFPAELSELLTAKDKGLFPSPQEISFICSCPDWASMCKHVAAVLYGVGARLDSNPELFFLLRNVNIEELISESVSKKSQSLLQKSQKKSDRIIDDDDISKVFGIDIEDGKDI